jgi:hypothetical protein
MTWAVSNDVAYLTAEARARSEIDGLLAVAGCSVQCGESCSGARVAVRELVLAAVNVAPDQLTMCYYVCPRSQVPCGFAPRGGNKGATRESRQVCVMTSTTVTTASAIPPTVNSPTVRNRSGASSPVRSA